MGTRVSATRLEIATAAIEDRDPAPAERALALAQRLEPGAAAIEPLQQRLDAKPEVTPDDELVMLKLTLPEQDNLYADLIDHPRVLKVVALSGGYSREEANDRLTRQNGMVASFSRALTEGLTAQQSDADFDATLDASIQSIFDSSST